MRTREKLQRAYDQLADEYAERFCDELDRKPFDRELLGRFVAEIPRGFPICDLGCGSGHVTHYLSTLGADALGIDLSPAMVEVASNRYPSVCYEVGNMLSIPHGDRSWGGIVALYAMIHVAPHLLPRAFAEMFRVLVPGGGVLLSFHGGEGELEEENLWDQGVSFHCYLYEVEEVTVPLESVGFHIHESHVREPYESEYPTERVYIWAKKPGGDAE